jgi:hypothetical protein
LSGEGGSGGEGSSVPTLHLPSVAAGPGSPQQAATRRLRWRSRPALAAPVAPPPSFPSPLTRRQLSAAALDATVATAWRTSSRLPTTC